MMDTENKVEMPDTAFQNYDYLWIVAKGLLQYFGNTDIISFIHNSYYVKANITQNMVEERVSGVMDFKNYPNSYDGFLVHFAENLFPTSNSDSIILAFNRNALLQNYDNRKFFWGNEFSLVDQNKITKQFSAYCQLFLKNGEVFASIVFIDRNWFHNKALVRQNRNEFDQFTGMYNRAYGTRLSIEWIQYHPHEVASVLIVGIDNFDQIKDRYGQKVVNAIISHLTEKIRSHFDNNRIVSRFSESEFCILLMNTPAERAEMLLQGLSVAELSVEAPNGEAVPYYISVGYSMYPQDSQDFSELCRMAEIALDISSEQNPQDSVTRFSRDMLMKGKHRLGFNMMEIANGIPGAIIVYRADRDDEEILYANNEALRIFECDTFEEFQQHTGGKFSGVVYPEDYERVESSIWDQINSEDNTKGVDYVKYRIITKNGIIKEVDDIGRLVKSPYYGEIFYVFLHDVNQKRDILRGFTLNVHE